MGYRYEYAIHRRENNRYLRNGQPHCKQINLY